MVDIKTGVKAYQGIDIVNGKPIQSGWKIGKHVQRAHTVVESRHPPGIASSTDGMCVNQLENDNRCIYVLLNNNSDEYASDTDATKSACMREYNLIPPAVPV